MELLNFDKLLIEFSSLAPLRSLEGFCIGATRGPLRVYDGDFRSPWDHCGMIVDSLWVYEGTFSKTLISRTYFNDFIKGMSEFGIDLGLLWDFFWHMRVTLDPFLGSLWGHFGHIDAD